MDFFAKKYTVLMNNEPVEIWIKNGNVKKANFMEEPIDLKNLSNETLNQIKDSPTRIVNGNNLTNNENFTSTFSKGIDAKLTLAIKKRDMKTLSRFARSDLVPESHKRDFYEAINRPRGIRGLIVRGLNKINKTIQTIANKMDNFIVNQRERVANVKMDKYLSTYQLKEFNKAPPFESLDLNKNLDPKLAQLAQNFVKGKSITSLGDEKTEDKILQEKFFAQAVGNGHSVDDAKIAIFKEVQAQKQKEKSIEVTAKVSNQSREITDLQATIKALETQIQNQKLKEASKNESLSDFKTLSKNMDPLERIDVLSQNKEYQTLDEKAKKEFENEFVFNQNKSENITLDKKSEEVKEITKEVKTQNVIKPIIDSEVLDNWKVAQLQNRHSEIPTQKYMNLSAIKFNGVSSQKLNDWNKQMSEMRERGIKTVPTQEKVDLFIKSSLENARKLQSKGCLVEVLPNEFKFRNEKEREKLYANEMQKEKSFELKDALKDISSEVAFKKILKADGSINVDRLVDYSNKLQEVTTQVQLANKANIEVTKEDLKELNNSQAKSQDQSRARA